MEAVTLSSGTVKIIVEGALAAESICIGWRQMGLFR